METRNMLTRRQSFLLGKWLDDNWDEILAACNTLPQVSQLFNLHISNNMDTSDVFRVTTTNVRGVLKAIGRTWPRRQSPNKSSYNKKSAARFVGGQLLIMHAYLEAVIQDIHSTGIHDFGDSHGLPPIQLEPLRNLVAGRAW
jgi:hypothetical protein